MFSFIFKLEGKDVRRRAAQRGNGVMVVATAAHEIRSGATAIESPSPGSPPGFHRDRKSLHSRQMTSCGTAMPWDCADYSNSLNKHAPINHSPTLSNPAHNSAAHLLFCRAACVFVHSCMCALVCFYMKVGACICISKCI